MTPRARSAQRARAVAGIRGARPHFVWARAHTAPLPACPPARLPACPDTWTHLSELSHDRRRKPKVKPRDALGAHDRPTGRPNRAVAFNVVGSRRAGREGESVRCHALRVGVRCRELRRPQPRLSRARIAKARRRRNQTSETDGRERRRRPDGAPASAAAAVETVAVAPVVPAATAAGAAAEAVCATAGLPPRSCIAT